MRAKHQPFSLLSLFSSIATRNDGSISRLPAEATELCQGIRKLWDLTVCDYNEIPISAFSAGLPSQ